MTVLNLIIGFLTVRFQTKKGIGFIYILLFDNRRGIEVSGILLKNPYQTP